MQVITSDFKEQYGFNISYDQYSSFMLSKLQLDESVTNLRQSVTQALELSYSFVSKTQQTVITEQVPTLLQFLYFFFTILQFINNDENIPFEEYQKVIEFANRFVDNALDPEVSFAQLKQISPQVQKKTVIQLVSNLPLRIKNLKGLQSVIMQQRKSVVVFATGKKLTEYERRHARFFLTQKQAKTAVRQIDLSGVGYISLIEFHIYLKDKLDLVIFFDSSRFQEFQEAFKLAFCRFKTSTGYVAVRDFRNLLAYTFVYMQIYQIYFDIENNKDKMIQFSHFRRIFQVLQFYGVQVDDKEVQELFDKNMLKSRNKVLFSKVWKLIASYDLLFNFDDEYIDFDEIEVEVERKHSLIVAKRSNLQFLLARGQELENEFRNIIQNSNCDSVSCDMFLNYVQSKMNLSQDQFEIYIPILQQAHQQLAQRKSIKSEELGILMKNCYVRCRELLPFFSKSQKQVGKEQRQQIQRHMTVCGVDFNEEEPEGPELMDVDSFMQQIPIQLNLDVEKILWGEMNMSSMVAQESELCAEVSNHLSDFVSVVDAIEESESFLVNEQVNLADKLDTSKPAGQRFNDQLLQHFDDDLNPLSFLQSEFCDQEGNENTILQLYKDAEKKKFSNNQEKVTYIVQNLVKVLDGTYQTIQQKNDDTLVKLDQTSQPGVQLFDLIVGIVEQFPREQLQQDTTLIISQLSTLFQQQLPEVNRSVIKQMVANSIQTLSKFVGLQQLNQKQVASVLMSNMQSEFKHIFNIDEELAYKKERDLSQNIYNLNQQARFSLKQQSQANISLAFNQIQSTIEDDSKLFSITQTSLAPMNKQFSQQMVQLGQQYVNNITQLNPLLTPQQKTVLFSHYVDDMVKELIDLSNGGCMSQDIDNNTLKIIENEMVIRNTQIKLQAESVANQLLDKLDGNNYEQFKQFSNDKVHKILVDAVHRLNSDSVSDQELETVRNQVRNEVFIQLSQQLGDLSNMKQSEVLDIIKVLNSIRMSDDLFNQKLREIEINKQHQQQQEAARQRQIHEEKLKQMEKEAETQRQNFEKQLTNSIKQFQHVYPSFRSCILEQKYLHEYLLPVTNAILSSDQLKTILRVFYPIKKKLKPEEAAIIIRIITDINDLFSSDAEITAKAKLSLNTQFNTRVGSSLSGERFVRLLVQEIECKLQEAEHCDISREPPPDPRRLTLKEQMRQYHLNKFSHSIAQYQQQQVEQRPQKGRSMSVDTQQNSKHMAFFRKQMNQQIPAILEQIDTQKQNLDDV